MPMLGSKRSHEACGVRIRDYLELKDGRPRAIAHDFVNIHGKDYQRNWGYVMDRTREEFGNDGAWRGKDAVTYNHFVVSPDPRDGVDVDTLRELTMRWVREFFGDGANAGRLGNFEVAVVYHDDNENHVPHAHVIVNNTDLDSGRRLQIDNATNERTLPNRLQEIAKDMGLRYFDNDVNERIRKEIQQAGRYFTKEERKLLRQGRFSWKQDLANNLQVARRTSRNEAEFLDACDRLGIAVEQKGDDWMFSHPANPERWKVRGYRLGKAYSRTGIAKSIEDDAARMAPRNPQVRENVAARIGDEEIEAFDVLQGFIDSMKLAVVVERGVTVAQAAKTLKVNDDYKIRCAEDYGREIARLDSIIKKLDGGEGSRGYMAQRKLLAEARDIAAHGSFFANVPDAGARPHGGKPAPAGTGDQGRKRAQDRNRESGRARSQGTPTRNRNQGKKH
ncbi:relaxase/mobilization nuclease domain-containing protein [Raoultibacter timonensis]|uniref:MobA/VirD2-like nuclease domain-containing protein n=1 Tax=Raoultibacter timonensis TaxID=1907662 RepID=A0ABN6MA27_9ACTN|nr:relaxase/mobilization nuclease domain-containing protein [Raoultibacter timonensis]BDE94863.1 hypothetical protein CE91St30_01960 [Raoultibacter timonensis]BDF49466.1 hypothetical protein CE91St31_01960 [Raoultibacter timonensis]